MQYKVVNLDHFSISLFHKAAHICLLLLPGSCKFFVMEMQLETHVTQKCQEKERLLGV